MSVEILNDATISDFVNDDKTFNFCVMERFKKLDVNGDGFLDEKELRVGLRIPPLAFEETGPDETADDFFNVVYREFDLHKTGGIDAEEFKCLIRKVMLALARGIGNFPLQFALEPDSLLMKAVEREKAKAQN